MKHDRKKELDNLPEMGYNILREAEGDFFLPIPTKVSGTFPYPNNYKVTLEYWINKLKPLFDKYPIHFPYGKPIFAGGFFRDVKLSRIPNDLDLFINSHGLDTDQLDDDLCLLLSYMKGVEVSRHDVNNEEGNYFPTISDAPEGDDQKFFRNRDAFVIYNVHPTDLAGDVGGNNLENEVLHTPLQIICKDMGPTPQTLSSTYHDFDYGAVMISMDLDGNISVSPKARMAYERDTIIVTDGCSPTRANRYFSKYNYTYIVDGKVTTPAQKTTLHGLSPIEFKYCNLMEKNNNKQ